MGKDKGYYILLFDNTPLFRKFLTGKNKKRHDKIVHKILTDRQNSIVSFDL